MSSRQCDVFVAGGGPGGFAAAIAAARNGADTLLVERYGFLGGMATMGLVNPFMTYWAGEEQIIEGILQELVERLTALGAYGKGSRTAFDPEAYKHVCDMMAQEAGVRLLFHTMLTDASTSGAQITSVEISNKSGKSLVEAKVYIDGTGDADLAYLAGARCEKGRDEDGLTQPMTLNFRVCNVDPDRIPSRDERNRLYDIAKAEGRLDCPRENILMFYTTRIGEMHFNQTRINCADGTSAEDLTKAEIEARRQMWQFLEFLRRDVAGFENAEISHSGPQIGIRESRRVIGDYVMTADDIVNAAKFDDCIARGSYGIDIHSPTGAGTVIRHLKPGESYDIPYRSLTPLGIDNLLIAGRPISSTHEAHSAARIMPICMAMGQAAGTAAALSVKRGVAPRSLDVSLLRDTLRSQGANLG